MRWPAVPRAAVSASARGGSRKKVFEKQNWCWENLSKTLFFLVGQGSFALQNNFYLIQGAQGRPRNRRPFS